MGSSLKLYVGLVIFCVTLFVAFVVVKIAVLGLGEEDFICIPLVLAFLIDTFRELWYHWGLWLDQD